MLSPKQKAFADNYILTLNAGQSYIDAGYKASTMNTAYVSANKLLRNPKIKAYVEQKMLSKDTERVMKQDELLERYTRLARGEGTEETIVVMNNRYERVRKEPDFKTQLKAMEHLGKVYALFTDKHDIRGDIGLHINVDYGDELEDS